MRASRAPCPGLAIGANPVLFIATRPHRSADPLWSERLTVEQPRKRGFVPPSVAAECRDWMAGMPGHDGEVTYEQTRSRLLVGEQSNPSPLRTAMETAAHALSFDPRVLLPLLAMTGVRHSPDCPVVCRVSLLTRPVTLSCEARGTPGRIDRTRQTGEEPPTAMRSPMTNRKRRLSPISAVRCRRSSSRSGLAYLPTLP
jgi:hypothetical protein